MPNLAPHDVWNHHGSFPAAHIFKPVVGAYRNGVLTGRQIVNRKFVSFDRRVADISQRHDKRPVASIEAILRSFHTAGGVARYELHLHVGHTGHIGAGGVSVARRSDRGVQMFDSWRSVVHFKAFAQAFRSERRRRRIRRRIRGHDFHIIRAVGKRCGIPGIKFLLQLVLQ